MAAWSISLSVTPMLPKPSRAVPAFIDRLTRLITMSPYNRYSKRYYYTKPRPLILGLMILRHFLDWLCCTFERPL